MAHRLCNVAAHTSGCTQLEGLFIYMKNWLMQLSELSLCLVFIVNLHFRHGECGKVGKIHCYTGNNRVAGYGDTFAYCVKKNLR